MLKLGCAFHVTGEGEAVIISEFYWNCRLKQNIVRCVKYSFNSAQFHKIKKRE